MSDVVGGAIQATRTPKSTTPAVDVKCARGAPEVVAWLGALNNASIAHAVWDMKSYHQEVRVHTSTDSEGRSHTTQTIVHVLTHHARVEGEIGVRPNGTPLLDQSGYVDAFADNKAGKHAMTQFRLHFNVRGLEMAQTSSDMNKPVEFDSATGMPVAQPVPAASGNTPGFLPDDARLSGVSGASTAAVGLEKSYVTAFEKFVGEYRTKDALHVVRRAEAPSGGLVTGGDFLAIWGGAPPAWFSETARNVALGCGCIGCFNLKSKSVLNVAELFLDVTATGYELTGFGKTGGYLEGPQGGVAVGPGLLKSTQNELQGGSFRLLAAEEPARDACYRDASGRWKGPCACFCGVHVPLLVLLIYYYLLIFPFMAVLVSNPQILFIWGAFMVAAVVVGVGQVMQNQQRKKANDVTAAMRGGGISRF